MRKVLSPRPSKRVLLFAGLMLIGTVLLTVIRFSVPTLFTGSRSKLTAVPGNQALEDFLKRHWQRPIPLQGMPPSNYSELEASLKPEACGSCHKQQYTDWKESLHSRAMGAGPLGQIVDLATNSPAEAIQCMTCHAPLSEQLPVLPKSAASETIYEKNTHLDQDLQLRGVTCAACHVRQHRRFGPPKADNAAAAQYSAGMRNHGGAERTPYFERAEFCKDCHQFDPETSLLVNGKPLQDTYREWQNSMWARDGTACQDCHMSQRRHLWKGIHDREWVKGGIQFKANVKQAKSGAKETAIATIEITNSAVGHKFPTYITPKVFVRASVLDHSGKTIGGTLRQQTIGWDVRFENGEWKELFDTRIPPRETFKRSFEWALPTKANKIRIWLEVHPDHFYHVHFYPVYLKGEDLSAEGKTLIGQALKESGETSYVLFDELILLN